MILGKNVVPMGRVLNLTGTGSGSTLLSTTPVVFKVASRGCTGAKLMLDFTLATGGTTVTVVFVDGSAIADAGLMTNGAQILSTAHSFNGGTGELKLLHVYTGSINDVIDCDLSGRIDTLWIGVFANANGLAAGDTFVGELTLVDG